jgi:hypothetical protein
MTIGGTNHLLMENLPAKKARHLPGLPASKLRLKPSAAYFCGSEGFDG